MINKILIIIAFTFSGYCLANNDCEITYPSKEYKTATKVAAPLENLFNKKLSFRTPVPYKLMAADSIAILFFKSNKNGSDKIINYFTIWQDINGYSPKDLYLKAFDLEKGLADDQINGARTALKISCKNNSYQEIKLKNTEYRVLLSKEDSDKDKYNVYVIPNTTNKLKVVYFIQFKNFDISEIGSLLSTMEEK